MGSEVVRVPKDFLDVFPVTIAKGAARRRLKELHGWNTVKTVEILSSRVLSAFDLQTFLSILYLYTKKDAEDGIWVTKTGRRIPVKIITCKWSTFVQEYRKKQSYQSLSVFESIKNVISLEYIITRKNGSKENQRLFWNASVYYYLNGEFIKVNSLRGNGRHPKRLYIGFSMDKKVWKKCHKGLLVNTTPILSSTNAMFVLLGTWIQVQKYTAIEESALFMYVLRTSIERKFHRRNSLFHAFNLLQRAGIITSWRFTKRLGELRFEWVKENTKTEGL